jgi:hypothetical protein
MYLTIRVRRLRLCFRRELYAFTSPGPPFLGFTSPTPGLLELSGACLCWLPGLLPAAPTGRTVLAVCEQ